MFRHANDLSRDKAADPPVLGSLLWKGFETAFPVWAENGESIPCFEPTIYSFATGSRLETCSARGLFVFGSRLGCGDEGNVWSGRQPRMGKGKWETRENHSLCSTHFQSPLSQSWPDAFYHVHTHTHTHQHAEKHTNTRQSNLIQTISESATFLQLHGAFCKGRVSFGPFH